MVTDCSHCKSLWALSVLWSTYLPEGDSSAPRNILLTPIPNQPNCNPVLLCYMLVMQKPGCLDLRLLSLVNVYQATLVFHHCLLKLCYVAIKGTKEGESYLLVFWVGQQLPVREKRRRLCSRAVFKNPDNPSVTFPKSVGLCLPSPSPPTLHQHATSYVFLNYLTSLGFLLSGPGHLKSLPFYR